MFEESLPKKRAGEAKKTGEDASLVDEETKRKGGAAEEQQQQRHAVQSRHRFTSLPVRAPLILSRVEFDANGGAGKVCDKRRRAAPPPPPAPSTSDATPPVPSTSGATLGAAADTRRKCFRIGMASVAGGDAEHSCCHAIQTDSSRAAVSACASTADVGSAQDGTAATARLLVSSGLHITPGSKFGCNWLA
jgi:hypothetical protein